MKWSKPKREKYHTDYRISGRNKGYKLEVIYASIGNHFYFMTYKDDSVYNSLWDNKSFKTKEECMTACELWVEEQ